MLTLIETRNFRSLKAIHQPLENFHVLVGPNASGKTTFLDVISFIGDIVKKGIDEAIDSRGQNYNALTFAGKGGEIELAIEASIPDTIRKRLWDVNCDIIRYEIKIGLLPETLEHAILEERVLIFESSQNKKEEPNQLRLVFPESGYNSQALIIGQKYKPTTYRQIVRKNLGGSDTYADETYKKVKGQSTGGSKGWVPAFKLGIKRSALGNMPADENKLPATDWLKNLVTEGVQLFILDSQNIRKSSPPGRSTLFKTDGSNLPWVINDLQKDAKRFRRWIEHLQTALPDIKDIDTIERQEDRHRYLRVHYQSGIIVPSWLVSDGTLRLLALTLPAYLKNFSGIYLIEEPENGVHPVAIESVYQSLSSVYGAQMLLATHSPIILGMVEPSQVLCFAKTADGATDIVSGDKHPALQSWRNETSLSILYASGVLG